MTTAAERARGITLWVQEGATQDEIARALTEADEHSRLWLAAQVLLSDADIERIRALERRLLKAGDFDERLPAP